MAPGPMAQWFMRRVVRSRMAWKDVLGQDGLYAIVCGSGSPLADAHRSGPCIAVSAGEHFFFVDAGQGSTRNAQLMHLPLAKTQAILLTHFHSDHIANLGELMLQRWASGSNAEPVDVIGPQGVQDVVEGFNMAYRSDVEYRAAHHGPDTMPPTGAGGRAKPFELSPASDASAVVFDRDGVKITAFRVDHRPVEPAVGYRFDYKRRSLVISGDTSYSESVLAQSSGADLLFHDALSASLIQMVGDNAGVTGSPAAAKVMHDIPSYHATPEDAARIASGAGVRQLVLYHIIPPVPRQMEKLFLGDAKRFYGGPLSVARDGMLFFMPPQSARIETKRLLR
ncbi:MAG: MBL fold metallo-hydrolase [Coriobacteriia bacterium]|nr:MBL fold metallo-hydrolase [Coriobacteriia bacterium]